MKTDYIVGFVIIVLVVSFSLIQKPAEHEEFTITTKFGETYKFKAAHFCGKSLRKAAKNVFGVENAKISKKKLKRFVKIVRSLAQVYNNDLEQNPCKIVSLTVKLIPKVK